MISTVQVDRGVKVVHAREEEWANHQVKLHLLVTKHKIIIGAGVHKREELVHANAEKAQKVELPT